MIDVMIGGAVDHFFSFYILACFILSKICLYYIYNVNNNFLLRKGNTSTPYNQVKPIIQFSKCMEIVYNDFKCYCYSFPSFIYLFWVSDSK